MDNVIAMRDFRWQITNRSFQTFRISLQNIVSTTAINGVITTHAEYGIAMFRIGGSTVIREILISYQNIIFLAAINIIPTLATKNDVAFRIACICYIRRERNPGQCAEIKVSGSIGK